MNIVNHAAVGPNKTVQLTLSNPTGATLGTPINTTLTIINDYVPQISVQVTATGGAFSPDPAPINTWVDATLSAQATRPVPTPPDTISAPAWAWQLAGVQYSDSDQGPWNTYNGGGFSCMISSGPTSSSDATYDYSSVTITASFPDGAYWQVGYNAQVDYTDTNGADYEGAALAKAKATPFDFVILRKPDKLKAEDKDNDYVPIDQGNNKLLPGALVDLKAQVKPATAKVSFKWTVRARDFDSGVASDGGTFTAGNYVYVITATLPDGELARNRTKLLVRDVLANQKVTLNWPAVPDATGYKIYRTTLQADVYDSPALVAAVGAVTTYVDTGAVLTAGSPGQVFADYIANATEGNLIEVSDALDLEGQTVKIYWADSANKPVKCTVTGDGAKSQSKTAKLIVERPTVEPGYDQTWAQQKGVVQINEGKVLFGLFQGAEPKGQNPGMEFRATVKVPGGYPKGQWQLVQTTIARRSLLTVGGVNENWDQNGETVLDNDVPYPFKGPTKDDGPAGPFDTGSPGQAVDNPVSGLDSKDYTKKSVNDDYKMYIMFKPGELNAKWVPLQYVGWSWKGTATFANAWALTGTDKSIQAPKDTQGHPTWQKNFAKGDYK